MKGFITTAVGVLGSFFAYLFGGWDASIITLLIFMAVDYVFGLIVAGVFHKSTKSETGALESRAGWKGLVKKGITMLFVVIAVRLDILLLDMMAIESSFVRDGVCIAFIVNELISIIENAGLMGIPIPSVIKKSIELLKGKEKGDTNV